MSHENLTSGQIADLRRLDVAHHLPGQSDYKQQAELGGARLITRARGCMIHDAEGNEILDGMAGLWCVNAGYGREELARVAYEQMQELPYYNTFFKTASVPTVRMVVSRSRWPTFAVRTPMSCCRSGGM